MESLTDLSRRRFLTGASLVAASWLTPVGHYLARAAETDRTRQPARSVIVLWLQGGPSQLETFDPHSDTDSAAGSRAIGTALKGVQLGTGLEQTAAELCSIALVRSVVSKEGDHERATYAVKTGFRPDPTIHHPSIGAICCHELPVAGTDIPRHISILPGQWPARGGYLGDGYDAFQTWDPADKVPDVTSHLPADREKQRLQHLDAVEKAFPRGRQPRVDGTLHRETVANARRMMTSDQLKAFDVSLESLATRIAYGDTPFGRGCLAARRLIEVGVRCVEVTLGNWDSHVNNHAIHSNLLKTLDPAFATLIRDLRERKLLDRTVVLCGGEFGRTPKINPAGGRDHWPNGFSVALAGGGLHGGQVIGATDPEGLKPPVDPVAVADVHATVLTALGIDPQKLNSTPIGRTVRFSEGRAIEQLL